MKTTGIKIKGYYGTWYIVDTMKYKGRTIHLLESEQFGDEAAALIVSEKFQSVILSDVWNGFGDLEN